MTNRLNEPTHSLKLRHLGIDTHQERVVFMRSDCHVCRAEGFAAQARIQVRHADRSIIATLNVVTSDLLQQEEAGLSEAAWRWLGVRQGDRITLSHAPPLESLGQVRSKIYGNRLGASAIHGVIRDVAAGLYSDIHLSSFITACAGDRLNLQEIIHLTRAMVDVGERLNWGTSLVVDKHCVGGLPGNRTTLLVVPIVAAFGMVMPKTSSRAITSPAGTADTMETLAPVNLDLSKMRSVVEREGGCIAWGGAMRLSPADDVLIGVERALDLDSKGQLVASVLSKKAAAGSTHVVIDIPVGSTAKVRTPESAQTLTDHLIKVGQSVGLEVRVAVTDGSQPVGCGIGPALEARDVLAVLRGWPDAPVDLRERALILAGLVLEFSPEVTKGAGKAVAQSILDTGQALRKFEAICEAQGGMREPPCAKYTHEVPAIESGRVASIDNRRLARVAKLAGAPTAHASGLKLHTSLEDNIEKGQPVFTVHAEAPGELAYALDYVNANPDIVRIEEAR